MCDGKALRGRIAVGSVLLVLGMSAGAVSGQDTEAALRAHIDSLLPLVEQARVEAVAAEAALEARARREAERASAVDTLRIGALTVLAPPEDAARARAAFESVWADHFRGIEGAALAAWIFTFHVGERTVPIYVAPGTPTQRILVDPRDADRRVASRVRAALADAIARDLEGLPVQRWASHNPLLEPDGQAVYRAVATAASKATRGCLGGDLEACTVALGLGDLESPLEAWYTPEERRGMVAEWMGGMTIRERPREFERCAVHRDLDACDRLLTRMDRGWAPLPGSVRGSLLRLALQRGGEGAWARLLDDPARSPAAALEHASGMPLPELVADWRLWMLEQRPASHAGLGLQGLIALVWFAFFATLASRSTRWRLG